MFPDSLHSGEVTEVTGGRFPTIFPTIFPTHLSLTIFPTIFQTIVIFPTIFPTHLSPSESIIAGCQPFVNQCLTGSRIGIKPENDYPTRERTMRSPKSTYAYTRTCSFLRVVRVGKIRVVHSKQPSRGISAAVRPRAGSAGIQQRRTPFLCVCVVSCFSSVDFCGG